VSTGAGQDYFAGASRSELVSNAKVKFAFGAIGGYIRCKSGNWNCCNNWNRII
jgi:hypothetical protein